MNGVLFEVRTEYLNIINVSVDFKAISTQVFLVFLCLKANAEMVHKFQVATACFSCSPPDFKLIKITPCC
jgi:hypothetical protein